MPRAKVKNPKPKTAARSSGRFFRLPSTISRQELLIGGSDHAFRQLLYDLSYVATLIEAVRRNLASEINLTPPQYNIVMVVAERMGIEGVSIRDVAEHLHVTGAFVTAEANKLETMNLLIRVPNPHDGRSILLKLSPFAETELRKIADKIRRYNDRFFGLITKEEFGKIAGSLVRLIHGGESALAELPSPIRNGRSFALRRAN